ncbi:MAG TPA: 2-oxoglutarate dehydrogenase complex dihydrolipoyllysine-residue succinyltransferase [Gammaproteobacteria bacterium]
MVVEVKVPVLAESVAEASILKWHKKPGDPVNRGDSLTDIETDKVTLEVAAPNNGVLKEILKEEGADVTSNEVIARIDTSSEKAAETGTSEETDGDREAETETATATAAGGQAAPAQQSLPDIEKAGPKLSPAVRHLLSQHDLDAETVMQKAGKQRITKEDVQNFINDQQATPETAAVPEPEPEKSEAPAAVNLKPAKIKPAPAAKAPPVAADEQDVEGRLEKRVPMTRLRRRVAERLLSAQHENAILTTFNEVNMQPVLDIRKRYQAEFEEIHGVKLGFMSFFTRAVVESLKKFPVINASVDGNDIIYHGYFDIGIAVSSPRGLVVPILRDADSLSLADIEIGIRELSDKARESRLELEELTGGTFTITNGGVFGSLLSTPIINPPQSAILGMHKMQDRPVAENGKVVIRPMMFLALSYDHRIIDGRDAVQFLVSIKEHLEDPARLLLQV